jgi:hypothetical protein
LRAITSLSNARSRSSVFRERSFQPQRFPRVPEPTARGVDSQRVRHLANQANDLRAQRSFNARVTCAYMHAFQESAVKTVPFRAGYNCRDGWACAYEEGALAIHLAFGTGGPELGLTQLLADTLSYLQSDRHRELSRVFR